MNFYPLIDIFGLNRALDDCLLLSVAALPNFVSTLCRRNSRRHLTRTFRTNINPEGTPEATCAVNLHTSLCNVIDDSFLASGFCMRVDPISKVNI